MAGFTWTIGAVTAQAQECPTNSKQLSTALNNLTFAL